MASQDLTWLIIRNSSSFLVKRNRQNLTLEPNNLKGRNSFRYSGLVQKHPVGVQPAKDGKGVVLVTRKNSGARKPAKNYHRVELKRDSRRTFRSIKNMVEKSGYRKDLSMTAVRRAAAILKSQRPVVPKKAGRVKKD